MKSVHKFFQLSLKASVVQILNTYREIHGMFNASQIVKNCMGITTLLSGRELMLQFSQEQTDVHTSMPSVLRKQLRMRKPFLDPPTRLAGARLQHCI